MWLFLKNGFFSVVQHRTDDGLLVARARHRDDADWLAQSLNLNDAPDAAGYAVIVSFASDYPFRVIVKREVFARFLASQAWGLDYDNFKNAAAAVDPARSPIYHDVWATMTRLTPPSAPRRWLSLRLAPQFQGDEPDEPASYWGDDGQPGLPFDEPATLPPVRRLQWGPHEP